MLNRSSSARVGISPADISFLETLLASGGKESALSRLWDDPDAVTGILDLKEIHRALLESPVALPVSPSLYFYRRGELRFAPEHEEPMGKRSRSKH